MFDWIAIGFGATFGAFLFFVALVLSVLALVALVVGVLYAYGILRRHNRRIRRRHETLWSQCERRWDEIDNERRRLIREARIEKARPYLVPREPVRGKEWYGDPDELLRALHPGARIMKGGVFRS